MVILQLMKVMAILTSGITDYTKVCLSIDNSLQDLEKFKDNRRYNFITYRCNWKWVN